MNTLIIIAIIATLIQYVILGILLYARLSDNATVKDFFKEWAWQIKHGKPLMAVMMTPIIGLVFYIAYCLAAFINYLYNEILDKKIK
jgi:amino acid permease